MMTTSPLQSIAIERTAQLADTGEIAGVETEEGREHCFLQVEIEVRREERQQLKRGSVMHLADDPFAFAQ